MITNIAVIGCGNWGRNIIRNFAELGNLYAVSDTNLEKSGYFSKLYGAKNLSIKDLLNDGKIDGVVIAAPVAVHSNIAIECMRADKHVLVEKPIAMTSVEGEKMLEVSKQTKKHLMVGHLLQYHPVFDKLKELVKQGDVLGKVKYIYSNRLNFGAIRDHEDVLWCLGTHDVSMILSLTEEMPTSIKAHGCDIFGKNIIDKAQLNLVFNNGINAHINISWINPFKEHKMVVIGEKGMAVFDDTVDWNNKLVVYPHNVEPSSKPVQFEKFEPRAVIAQKSEPLRNECKYFVDLINARVPPKTDAEEGLRVLKVLEEASSSIKEK